MRPNRARQTRWRARALLATQAVALVAACLSTACHDPSDGTIARGQAIIDGVPDATHAAVGRLLINDNPARNEADDLCTATLVGARTVLTAAHCVSKSAFDRTPFLLGGVKYAARALVPHPDWNVNVSAYRNDLGLVLLVDAPPVAPATLRALAPAVGERVVVVGFGVTAVVRPDSGGATLVPLRATAGTRRSGEKSIARIEPRHFELLGRSGNSADGDSGGPVFAGSGADERLIGVVSASGDNYDTSYHVRVDLYLRWLRSVSGDDLRVDGECAADCDAGVTPRDAATRGDGGRLDGGGPRARDGRGVDGAAAGAKDQDGGCGVAAGPPSAAGVALACLVAILRRARRRRRGRPAV